MQSLSSLIAAAVKKEPNEDALKIARKLRTSMTVRQLDEAIAHEVRNIQRSTARLTERAGIQAFVGPAPGAAAPPIAVIAYNLREQYATKLRNTKVSLFNGKKKRWGELSADEHDWRAAHLEGQAKGILETAGAHRDAARVLRENGIRCLDDLAAREESVAA